MSPSTGIETKGVGDGGDSSAKSASTTVLTFVGGKDEDVDDRNSAFPDEAPPIGLLDEPIDDTMFYGDGIGELPETLVEAVFKTKTIEGLDGEYNVFRFKNSIQINYDTTEDNQIKDDTVRITVNSKTDSDTVEVTDYTTSGSGSGSFTVPQELFLTDPEKPSYTILADDWKEKSRMFDLMFDSRKKRAFTRPRHVVAEKNTYLTPNGDLVEGIRAATIWGSENPYTKKMSDPSEVPLLDDAVPDNPIIYNWIELTLLADGTTYVRVEDASPFPKHVGYLRGPLSGGKSTKRATSGLRYILDETATSSEDKYEVAIREDSNHVWERFKQQTEQGHVPYKGTNTFYWMSYMDIDSPLYDNPVMAYGEADDGSELSRKEILDSLPHLPLFPMPTPYNVNRDWHQNE